jgi:iron complex outermembrane receptor protein
VVLWLMLVCGVGGSGGAASLHAQATAGVVRGVVRDASGAPVGQAQVFIPALERGTLSDATGAFVLRGVPKGRHTLHVARMGHAPARTEIEVAADGSAAPIEVVLTATPLSLPGVTVTGTTGARVPLAVTQATTQLSGADLARELGLTLAQTLESQAGIASRAQGPSATMPVLRGLTGDRIVVLQDGQRSGDIAGTSVDHGMTIDPLAAERVEVIRGPATLLYGNNAIGGVVNVITPDVPSYVPARAEWSAGAQAQSAYPGAAASVRGTVPLGERWALGVRGGGRRSGDTRVPFDPLNPELEGRVRNTSAHNWNGSAGLGYVGDRVRGGGSLKAYDFAYGLPESLLDDAVTIHGQRREGTVRAEVTPSSAVLRSLRVAASAQSYSHREIQEDGGLGQAFDQALYTGDVLLRQQPIGRIAEGAWGVSGLWKRYTAGGPDALTPPADSRGFGVFTFQEISLGGPALEVGARFDDYRITAHAAEKFPEIGEGDGRAFRALSGSLGLRVPLAEAATLGVSVARSFRAPTIEELYSNEFHAGTAAWEQGDPALDAERGVSLEGVLRIQRARWNGQLAAYRNAIEKYVFLRYQGQREHEGREVPVLAYVQDRVRLHGIDGSLEWAASPALVLGAMGDYLRAAQADGTPLSYMPAPRLGAHARWNEGVFSVGGGVQHRFTQDRVGAGAADEPITPAHTLVHLHGGVRFRHAGAQHEVVLGVENLTNRLYHEATSVTKGYAPGPGRNLSLVYRMYW